VSPAKSGDRRLVVISLIVVAFLTGKFAVFGAYRGMSQSGHRSCKCGAVYDRSEHIAEAREISSFECAVCGKTIENWN
jgi:stage III sporulation protein SpoIIIAA